MFVVDVEVGEEVFVFFFELVFERGEGVYVEVFVVNDVVESDWLIVVCFCFIV